MSKKSEACLICGKRNSFRKKVNEGEGFVYLFCENCGCATLFPRSKVLDSIKKIYNDEYFNWGNTSGVKGVLFKINLYATYPDWITQTHKKTGKLLDVGAGMPDFVLSMKERGWDAYAQELSHTQSQKIAKAIGKDNVFRGDFHSVKLPFDFFDIVTFWHFLEHVVDPQITIKRASDILRRKGKIYLELPNVDSLTWKIFGNYYDLLRIPEHTFYFSQKSLRILFKNHGFKVQEISYPNKLISSFSASLSKYVLKKYGNRMGDVVFYLSLPFSLIYNIITAKFGRSELIRMVVKKT